tara:strand:+ start:161 stop:1054 length:894 start_codon:yes stop_codon:yes gene_type:complete
MNKSNINGWIFLDKPIGMTSNYALQKIRKIFKNCKAGFVGTLDPLASGYLPIALGKATKLIKYIEKVNKKYIFTIKWGCKTDTGDLEGKIVETNQYFPDFFSIEKKLSDFIGEVEQSPPKFSSLKINGFRAYELARKKIPFSTKNRKIIIKKITMLEKLSPQKAVFSVECSAGTYIRSLAESIAESLGAIGMVTELRRLRFTDCNKKLISLDYLLSLVHSDEQIKLVHPIDVVFKEIVKIQLSNKQVKKVLTGNYIEMKKLTIPNDSNMVLAKFENKFVALGLVEDNNFHPKKLLIS